MTIESPTYYSGIGKRKVNEDFLYPEQPKENDNLFLVCDGLGGMAYGEIASKFTAMAVQEYLNKTETFNTKSITDSIHFANALLHKFSDNHPKSKGMSTTIAMLVADKNHYYASWVGDSRVYHIRNGELIFKTRDHSYKEWLIDRGIEETQEGIAHVITQAIGGRQPLSPGINKIENVQSGDYLVLCTDGVLEGINEDDFLRFFTNSKSNAQILDEIVQICDEKSKDNHTLYILKTK